MSVWLTLPLLSSVMLPLYHRLEIYSIYEYLEMRFDVMTRFVSSVLFVIWRLLVDGGSALRTLQGAGRGRRTADRHLVADS